MTPGVRVLFVVVALVLAGSTLWWVARRPTRGARLDVARVRESSAQLVIAHRELPQATTGTPTIHRTAPAAKSSRTAHEHPASPSPSPASSGLVLFTARLRCPSQEACAALTQVRVGLGFIDESDRREFEASRVAPGSGSAPRSLDDLVNVRHWRTVSPTLDGPGVLRVGPIELPRCDAYDLLAWNNDALIYYYRRIHAPDAAATSSSLDAGLLEPESFTGVRLTLRGEAPFSSCRAIIERVPAAEGEETAGRFFNLARLMAPEFTEALSVGTPVDIVVGQPNLLVPLPPDEALRITLVAPSDVEAAPVEVPLVAGKIVDASIDLSDVFPQGAHATVSLEGTLEIGDTGLPLVGATITHERHGPSTVSITDERGVFRVPDLPMDRPTSFDVVTSAPPHGRPRVPARWHFDFVPPLTTTGSVVRLRWQVPAYRYLVLDLDSPPVQDVLATTQRPYPIYLIERMEAGAWQPVATDFFEVTGQQVTAAIEQAGRYRFVVGVNPVAVWPSAPADLEGIPAGGEIRTRLLATGQPAGKIQLLVRDAATNIPLVRAAVTVAGPYGSFPPGRWLTNDAGRVDIGPVDCDSASIWIEKSGYEAAQRTLSSGELRATTPIEITLRPLSPSN